MSSSLLNVVTIGGDKNGFGSGQKHWVLSSTDC